MKLRSILSALLLTAGVAAAPTAKSAIIMSIQQAGSDVLATASGDADITGFSSPLAAPFFPQVEGLAGAVFFGPPTAVTWYDVYGVAGPRAIGSGFRIEPTSASGSAVGVLGVFDALALPTGYVSGSPLAATMTFANRTIAGLGLNTGTYIWTWGSGANADSLTLYIGVPVPSAAVPVPASLLLLATGVAAAASLRRRKTS